MKKYRNLIIGALLVGLIFSLTGCSVSDYQKSIFDDDSKISKQADSYNFKSRVGSTTSEKSELKFNTFYGADTLWSIEAKEESEATVEYDLKLERGDFKVVLIGPDNKVVTIADGEKSGKQGIRVQKGSSRIKIVGKNAKGQVKINITGDKNLKVKRLNN